MAIALLALSGCSPTEPAPFPVGSIEIDDQVLTVWVADEANERYRGLRGVDALPDGIDGMLFVYDAAASASYGMFLALIPLDIWWFDATGMLLGSDEMTPCPEEPCASYPSPGPVSWVLETPLGSHEFPAGARISTVDIP